MKDALLAKLQELEEASQVMAEQAKENSALKLEVTKLQRLKEEAEIKWAASNSLAADLKGKNIEPVRTNGDLEAFYAQTSSEVAYLQKDKESLQKDKEDGLK